MNPGVLSTACDPACAMKIAVLGPGGVGGLLAGALERAGEEVIVVAREPTAAAIAERRDCASSSVTLGEFTAHPRAVARLSEPVDALIVATKAAGLQAALAADRPPSPALVLPLLNGLDHIALLRERFAPSTVLAGSIRVEADRPQPGVVVHTSPFLLVEMASRYESAARRRCGALARRARRAPACRRAATGRSASARKRR